MRIPRQGAFTAASATARMMRAFTLPLALGGTFHCRAAAPARPAAQRAAPPVLRPAVTGTHTAFAAARPSRAFSLLVCSSSSDSTEANVSSGYESSSDENVLSGKGASRAPWTSSSRRWGATPGARLCFWKLFAL